MPKDAPPGCPYTVRIWGHIRHATERAIILADGATLALKDFPLPKVAPAPHVQVSAVVEPVAADLNLDI